MKRLLTEKKEFLSVNSYLALETRQMRDKIVEINAHKFHIKLDDCLQLSQLTQQDFEKEACGKLSLFSAPPIGD
ncbi:CLUMA_CG003845, isoform A [Clunio marinus]|uniref:CLUMA_CG003845, isoform A n=1 Tax=Clunio marinus TaxID=568069 RepID=A0A1J1HQ03_9DIPT|nr:CLUMA_CG003845, isoform A [Clunio marinus]